MDIAPHFGREPFDTWHKKGFDRHIIQSGTKRDPRMSDVPTLTEVMDQYKTPEVVRRTARIILASGEFGRPMVMGPGNKPEHLKLMRDAYARAMRDPGLIEEARKGQMDMEYTSGEELNSLLRELMGQPRDVNERVKKILTQ